MTSVTFPTLLGGDGSTVTDDSNATTGLGNGGHRYRFLPTLINTVAMAQTAFNAANTAVTSPASLTATSTSSLTIGTGSKSLTLTQTGKGFNVGGYVLIAATAAPTAYMYGQITAFTPATGAMTVNVLSVNSSGTLAAWTISAAQPNFSLYSPSTGALSVYFDGTNLAIGGTTSAWVSTAKALDFGNNGAVANLVSGDFHFGQNTYYNGTNWIAKATGTGALYKQSAGTHTWSTAASVSAGAVQTWVQQLALDASGNGTLTGGLTAGGSVLPSVNNTYNLGSATFKWGTVYATTFSGNLTGNVTGNADTVTNGVYTTGAQTIAGVKTFSNQPVLSAGAQFQDSTAQNTAFVGRKAQVFTANGTFTIPAGITALKITAVGGGGGSGGANSNSPCSNAASSGGGGGGSCISYLTGLTPGSTIAVVIGAAGTAGAATPTAGGAGGNTVISSGTQTITTMTAGGGGGSAGVTNSSYAAGGTSGSATGGTVNSLGQKGSTGQGPSMGGFGGSSLMGFGGTSDGVSSVGQPGVGNGAGASGASASAAVTRAGAAGTAGVAVFEW